MAIARARLAAGEPLLPRDLAALMACSKSYVYKLIYAGSLRAVSIGHPVKTQKRKRYRIEAPEARRLLLELGFRQEASSQAA